VFTLVVRPFIVEGTAAVADQPAVVAEILADGTIRARSREVRARVTEAKRDWATGQVTDGRWIVWWQRRRTA